MPLSRPKPVTADFNRDQQVRAKSALIVNVGNRQCHSSPVIWPGFRGARDFTAVRCYLRNRLNVQDTVR